MSEYGKVTNDSGTRNKEVARTMDEKIGRRSWLRCALVGIAIIVAGFLIAGTVAAILWC